MIQTKLRQPLAEEMLFGKLEDGGSVIIGEEDDVLSFEYESLR